MSLLWRKVFIICHRCIIDEIKNGVSRRMCFFPAGAIRSEPYLPNFHKHMLSCSCTEVLKRYVDAMMVRAYTQLLDNFSVFVCLCIPVSTNSPRMISVSCYGFLIFPFSFSLFIASYTRPLCDLGTWEVWSLSGTVCSYSLNSSTPLLKNGAVKGVGFVFHILKIPHPHVWGSSSQRNQSPFAHIFTTCLMIL